MWLRFCMTALLISPRFVGDHENWRRRKSCCKILTWPTSIKKLIFRWLGTGTTRQLELVDILLLSDRFNPLLQLLQRDNWMPTILWYLYGIYICHHTDFPVIHLVNVGKSLWFSTVIESFDDGHLVSLRDTAAEADLSCGGARLASCFLQLPANRLCRSPICRACEIDSCTEYIVGGWMVNTSPDICLERDLMVV